MDAPNWREITMEFGGGEEIEVRFPGKMLASKTVARMITFSSKELIDKFTMTQNMFMHGQLIEC